jgi:two-component sensor histidine kinase
VIVPDTSHRSFDAPPHPGLPSDEAELVRLRAALAQERGECAALHAALAQAEARLAAARHDGHHRLRNTLHLACSLLNLQRGVLPDQAAQRALDEAAERVAVLGAVFSQLGREPAAGTDEAVRAWPLLAGLVDDVARCHDVAGRIAVRVEAVDERLPVAQAVPLVLIVRELAANSLRHGFPGDRRGTLVVRLTRPGQRSWQLDIADDGIGLDPAASVAGARFGLQLVGMLVEQLNGRLTRPRSAGTRHVVRFADPAPMRERPATKPPARTKPPTKNRARRARPSTTPAR